MAAVDEAAMQLTQAIEAAINPSTLQEHRVEAYGYIEEFKSTSPLCVPVGLLLFEQRSSPFVRHTGLQLLEHTVKFEWNSISSIEQEKLKEIALKLVAHISPAKSTEGRRAMRDEPHHIKEALCRLVVEIAKREWPQKWISLLSDLNNICSLGDVQTEIVLMVLLRLAEDAIGMDNNLQQNRKKQITNGLHESMDQLFSFFFKTLQKNTREFKDLMSKIQSGNVSYQAQAAVHQRLAEQALFTLTGYLDWAKFEAIFFQDCIILQMLCLLLEEDSLKILACECLLLIVSRKGKVEQRIPLMKLFSEDAILVMLSAAQKSITSEFDERQYLFLKRLCQVLVALGEIQLFQIWNAERPKEKPPNFRQYLEAVLAFSKHESLTLPLLTSGLWLTLLRNPVIKEDETFQAMFPSLLEMAQTTLVKVHFDDPEKSDTLGSVFNREDFSNSRSFISAFAQLRGEAMDIIRLTTLLKPTDAFVRGADWLQQKINQLSSLGPTTSCNGKLLRQEWVGLVCFLEAVISRFFQVENVQEIVHKEVTYQGSSLTVANLARNCIQSLINAETKNPNIVASITDATQAFFPFLVYNKDLLMEVLKKMLAVALFNTTGSPKAPWSNEVLHARRRACSAVYNICQDFADLLLPVLDAFKRHVQLLFVEELVPVKDRSTLMEALIVASTQLKDAAKQTELLVELLTPIRAIWLSEEMTRAITTPEELVLFTGLDKEQTEYGKDDKTAKGRFQAMLCITTMSGILRSSAKQYSIQSATSEGLSIGLMPNGTPYIHNPCASLLLPLLGNVLLLAKSLNSLYNPSVVSAMFSGYTTLLEMHELDKSVIFALLQPQEKDQSEAPLSQNPLKSARSFLYQLADCCYHTLGYACYCLGHDFYSLPGLAQLTIDSVVNSLHYIPNFRFRFVLRNFIKAFVLHCPECDYQSVLIPVFSPLVSFMLQHLEEEWRKVRQHQAESAADDSDEKDDTESKEIIEDSMVSIITRDYLDVFVIACTKESREGGSSLGGIKTTDEEEMKTEGEHIKKEVPDQYNLKLGSLGMLLLKTESINMQLLCTIFCSMTWLDSIACQKATRLAMPFIREMLSICKESGTRIPDTIFEQMFSQVLKGLHVHGQCSTQLYLLYAGQAMYELLTPLYPSLRQILQEMSNCPPEDLQTFEGLCFEGRDFPEKRKKEHFKKLVTGVIGKHIGEMFKNEIKIKDLPPIELKTKEKSSGDDSKLEGLSELFDPNKAS